MIEFLMPKLGADMTSGRLVSWYKHPGDAVRRGDVVAEVETEKGNIDVEIFSAGTIDRLLVQPGETVPVGTPLALVRTPEAGAALAEAVASPAVESPSPAAPEMPPPVTVARRPMSPGSSGRLRISPAARRRARELGVDPAAVVGTGRDGAITIEDIVAATRTKAERLQIEPAGHQQDRYARLRQTIAAAMARSKREIPHYYLSTTIDLNAALQWMAQRNESRPITERLLHGVILIKAVALALREVPELNAVWENGQVITKPDIHVGTAISLRKGGLVAPALHYADQLSLDELMGKFRDLVNRTRAGSLRSSELSDPTITISSLGEQGVEAVFGVIYPPQVALVGFGKIVERPWSVLGQIVSRPVVTATLSADHRVTDGHRGAVLLAAIGRLLQEPEKL